MILKQLDDFLRESGVQAIEAEGEKFDPNLHEAIAREAERGSSGRDSPPPDASWLSFERSFAAAFERGGVQRAGFVISLSAVARVMMRSKLRFRGTGEGRMRMEIAFTVFLAS